MPYYVVKHPALGYGVVDCNWKDIADYFPFKPGIKDPDVYVKSYDSLEQANEAIGRPSTYASIMKTLEDRGYVRKEGKTLFPTDTGDVVSSFLEENFGEYISDTFTATMEDKLDDISNGKRDYIKTLKDFYTPFLSPEVYRYRFDSARFAKG